MSKIMSDAMVMPATDTQTKLLVQTIDVKLVKCECCGLTEECTPTYIESIREKYHGKWICGLCGEAVKDEIIRNERQINTEEAITSHMNFCRKSTSTDPPPDPAVHLIAAMRQIIKRSLDSPTSLMRSMPSSPLKNTNRVRLNRSESCIRNLTCESSPFMEFQKIIK